MLNRKNLQAISLALFAVAILALIAYRLDTRPGGQRDQMEAMHRETTVYEGIPSEHVPDSIPTPDNESPRAVPLQTPTYDALGDGSLWFESESEAQRSCPHGIVRWEYGPNNSTRWRCHFTT